MRVAVISHTYVERENRKKLHAISGPDVDLTLFAPVTWSEGDLTRRWRLKHEVEEGVTIRPVRVTRMHRSPAAAWWHFGPLMDVLTTGKIDLLHMEEEPWSLCAIRAVRLARRFRVPTTLFTWQNLPQHPRWPLSALRRATLDRIDGWVAGNRAAADLLARVDDRKPMIVLPQLGVGVPTTGITSHQSEILRVGYVGRLVVAKGIADLLDALALIPSTQNWRCVIVGAGPARASLETKTDSLGIRDRVEFRGAVAHDAVADVWRTLDVLVLPSRTTPEWVEQFGHVLIEAMANGIAVVGSSSGAIPEVIGDSGVVFPEGDHHALARALTRLASDPAELTARKTAALARAGTFTHDRIAASLVGFWQTILQGSG